MRSRREDPGDGSEPIDAELLAASLLHELRQPLQGADAAATLLERAVRTLPQNDDWRMLRAQLGRIGEIVGGWEELLHPGEGEPASFAVGPVVSRAVDLLSHRIRPLGGRFRFSPDGPGAVTLGAPGALVHAATNVLANALDAVESAGGETRVELRVLPLRGGGAEVRVSDEGVGIAAEDRARIFEPRFMTKGGRRGGGLGLHIARRLVSRHGGEVRLVDERDPARLPWAVTEVCIALPPPAVRGVA